MISVIVPIYNVEDYLEECLRSIVSQTYTDLEILCVDDCTLDNSINIVRKFILADPRIRLITHKENRGLGGARNTGIREARGEYIMFIDSDDMVEPTMMEKMERAMREHKVDAAVCGISLVSGSQVVDHSSGFHVLKPTSSRMFHLNGHKERLTDIWPSAWNKIYRTALVREFACVFPERLLYEDHFFFYSYFTHIPSFYFVNEELYRYRVARQGSITSTPSGREKEVFTVLNSLEPIFSEQFDKDHWHSSFAKIAFRLTWERQTILWNFLPQWLAFARLSEKWLFERFAREELKQAIDKAIDPMDPFYRFLFSTGRKRAFFRFKLAVKDNPLGIRLYNKLRGVRNYRTNRHILKELLWVSWSTYHLTEELKHPIVHAHDLLTSFHENETEKKDTVL